MNISDTKPFNKAWMALVLAASMVLAGCASTQDDRTYSREQALRVQTVEYATVESANPVVIEGESSDISKVAGGIVGGIAGSSMGGGKGRQLTTAIGAIAGAVAGGAVQERATRANAVELTLRMDSGQLISVVQATNEQSQFAIGDRVKVLRNQGDVRVTPVP